MKKLKLNGGKKLEEEGRKIKEQRKVKGTQTQDDEDPNTGIVKRRK